MSARRYFQEDVLRSYGANNIRWFLDADLGSVAQLLFWVSEHYSPFPPPLGPVVDVNLTVFSANNNSNEIHCVALPQFVLMKTSVVLLLRCRAILGNKLCQSWTAVLCKYDSSYRLSDIFNAFFADTSDLKRNSMTPQPNRIIRFREFRSTASVTRTNNSQTAAHIRITSTLDAYALKVAR